MISISHPADFDYSETKSLQFENCGLYQEDFLKIIDECPKLRRLELLPTEDDDDYEDYDEDEIEEIKKEIKLKNLLEGITIEQAQKFHTFVIRGAVLKRKDINHCEKIIEEKFLDMAKIKFSGRNDEWKIEKKPTEKPESKMYLHREFFKKRDTRPKYQHVVAGFPETRRPRH